MLFRFSLLIVLLVPASARLCWAGEDEQTYHERLEFNPQTGEWVEIAPPVPGTEEGDLALARSLLARVEYKRARKGFKAWFKMYPDSSLWPEALFYAAETEIAAEETKPKGGHLIRAYEWLEELLEGWPRSELVDRAIRKEMIIAELLLFKDRKQKVWGGVFWLSGKEEALQILDRVIDDWARNTPTAEQALRLKADYHFQNGEFDEAEIAYTRIVRDFPRGQYHKMAMLRSGESALARFPGVEFDDADLLEAEVYLADFQHRYPQDAADRRVPQILDNVKERRAEKDYTVGRFYERTGALDAAVFYYRTVVDTWPATIWATESRNRLVALGVLTDETVEDYQDAYYYEDADVGGEEVAASPESEAVMLPEEED